MANLIKHLTANCTLPDLQAMVYHDTHAYFTAPDTDLFPHRATNLFLKGLILQDWIASQQDYREREGDPRIPSGKVWATRLTWFLWTSFHEGWLERCSDLHKSTMSTRTQLLAGKIAHLYSLAECLPTTEQHLFTPRPMRDLLKEPLPQQAAWVALNRLPLEAAYRRHSDRTRHSNRSILDYFAVDTPVCTNTLAATSVAARLAGCL